MKNLNPCCPLAVSQMAKPSKRKIYEILATEGEKTVGEITKKLKLKQPTVSYHLKMMEKEGLLGFRKKGRKVFYRIKMVCPEEGICFRTQES